MKKKEKSLKTLNAELFDLVCSKYYDNDYEVQTCVDRIYDKKHKMEERLIERKKKKETLGQKIKKALSFISIKTLLLCDKLIVKEKVSNQIMGYPVSEDLEVAEKEIKGEIVNAYNEKN